MNPDTQMQVPPPALYAGRVMHARLKPFRHRFSYRLFSLLIDIDDPAASNASWLLRHNRFGVLSFHDADHGFRDGSPLRPWVMRVLADTGLAMEVGAVRLLCFPRLLGFVFNPISIYYVFSPDGACCAVIYEVNNTFGETHTYVAPVSGEGVISQEAEKTFYVSPFIGMKATYAFSLRVPGEKLSIAIHQRDPEGALLVATQSGNRKPLSTREILKAVLRHPLMTLNVVLRIHTQALRLWWKGAALQPRTPKPNATISLATTSPAIATPGSITP